VANRQTITVAKPQLKVGDYVRIRLRKRKTFRKEEARYSSAVVYISPATPPAGPKP
jgi:hypothetical protein